MTSLPVKEVNAVLREGHLVASGTSNEDRRFPAGTIRLQIPHFKRHGLDVEEWLGPDFVYGTLNLSVAPMTVQLKQPEYNFKNIAWTDIFPPENFYLSKAEIRFKNATYRALLYIPDPGTKPDHFKPADLIEVIAARIPGLTYGDQGTLLYNPAAISIKNAAS